MNEIRLAPFRVAGQTVTFSWSVAPATTLYEDTAFALRFPESVDLGGVPDAIWWRVALLCLHSQWPLLRPCRVVLPFRLDPGEREFWLRMCDAEVATLEGWGGGGDFGRRIDIVESGSPLEPCDPVAPSTLAAACFSGGRDSLTQAALLSELAMTPLLVTTSSPRKGSVEHSTPRRTQVMADIQSRRGLELIDVSSTLRGCWNIGFTAPRYPIGVSEIGDAFLFCAVALVVAFSRGASSIYLASEAELQQSAWFGGQIVQYRHFMYSAATQRSLSTLFARFGISYGGLTCPLRQFQVQRLLGTRYGDLRDLQYSCWSMAGDEPACSRCGECRTNALNLMANGISPEEIGIDIVPLMTQYAAWSPRVDAWDSHLPELRRPFDMQALRCIETVTPELAASFVPASRRGSTEAMDALAAYARMRTRSLDTPHEPEPGYRTGYLQLVEERHRRGLQAIFDEHFAREDEDLHRPMLERSMTLTDWVTAPLARPELSWRAVRRPLSTSPPAAIIARPPSPAVRSPEELAELGELLPGPEPVLAGGNGTRPLRVAETLLDGNELEYVTECIRTNWVSSAGSFVGRFEDAFARAAGCEFAVACTSGTTALHLAVAAAGLGPGDEVILPTFTMIASANAVGYTGATPVLVDTDPETWNLDLDLVRDRIGPKTKAIMIVHTYGHTVDADAIRALAEANSLVVIEDAAEAHGASFNGRRAGSLGDVAAFSFYGNKIVTTGEGGMVTTNDPSIAAIARELRDHGFSAERHFWHRFKAFNFRLSNLQAAVGLAQVERLDELVALRRRTARLYRDALNGVAGLELPPTAPGHDDANWMFGVVVGGDFGCTRDQLRASLAASGVETRTFFVPIHVQPAYRDAFEGRRFRVAERLGARGLYLPSGPLMDSGAVDRVAEALASAGSAAA
jgi:perosamine synthetase